MKKNFNTAVYEIVAQVPSGYVLTYGQIAFMAGSPRASRIVGACMARAPQGLSLPYHRVIYSDGSLCKGDAFGGYAIQRQMLEREGVTFTESGKVDLKRHLWCG